MERVREEGGHTKQWPGMSVSSMEVVQDLSNDH
jgi:hypothetical protein